MQQISWSSQDPFDHQVQNSPKESTIHHDITVDYLMCFPCLPSHFSYQTRSRCAQPKTTAINKLIYYGPKCGQLFFIHYIEDSYLITFQREKKKSLLFNSGHFYLDIQNTHHESCISHQTAVLVLMMSANLASAQ